MSEIDTKRLLLKLDKAIREVNREIINPQIAQLKLTDLNPVVTMVAHARADYLKILFEIANQTENIRPTPAQIEKLKQYRETYEELLHASVALETAIERGYLDVL